MGVFLCSLLVLGGAGLARAADCPGNPDALGTSRTLVVDPTEHPRVGTMQFPQTLPLADHEVVLTFDDGPLPKYSKQVLQILDAQCVKATYFIIGKMAQAYPEMLREIAAAGHTIGTHSQNHPLSFQRMPVERVQQEVDQGIASVKAALGDQGVVTPFFRVPGLLRANDVEEFLASQGIMDWSADFPADDWKHISAAEVTRRALTRLEAHGKGILLLHDIHANTATALPTILRELKRRGYHVVHVVAATPTLPKTPTEPDQWYMHPPAHEEWPPVAAVGTGAAEPLLAAPDRTIFGPLTQPLGHGLDETAPARRAGHGRGGPVAALVPPPLGWPPVTAAAAPASAAVLPVPGLQSFEFSDVLGDRPGVRFELLGAEPALLPKAKTESPPPGTHAEATPTMRLSVTTALPEVGYP